MATPQQRIRAVYGFDFPDEFFTFWEFLQTFDPGLLSTACEMSPAAPFAIASGEPLGKHADNPLWAGRYHNDLPEFITVFHGQRYGQHWCYHFDDPGNLRPIVISYWHRDSVGVSIDGDTLFEVVQEQLESTVGSIEADEDSEDFVEELEAASKLEKILARYEPDDSDEDERERHEVGQTVQGLGIIVPTGWYRRLSSHPFGPPDDFTPPCPAREDVAPLLAEAQRALREGCPGTALELGHNLWPYAGVFPECYDLLESAYTRLDRLPLIRLLHAARELRTRDGLSSD